MKVYLFSGLGADERVFNRFKSTEEHFFIGLPWIDPKACNSLGEYAELLIAHYSLEEKAKSEPIAIGGVSMGGMIAQEIAQRIPVRKLILISTVCSRNEFPFLLRLANSLRIGPFLKKPFLIKLAEAGDKLTRKSGKGRSLFYHMLNDSDGHMLHFGAKAILAWQPPGNRVEVLRYHGDRDLVFPQKRIHNFDRIAGGNHFMVFEQGERISRLIAEKLSL